MANQQTNPILKFFAYLYIPIFIICLGLNCWLIVYEFFLKENTIALLTNYVDGASYSEDETYFMEINIFNNVVEVKVNYYTDANIPEQNEDGSYDTKFMMSTGVQFYINGTEDVGNQIATEKQDWRVFVSKTKYVELENCTYYSSPQGLDYGYVSGGVSLADQDAWIWDIQGDLVCIKSLGDVYTDKEIWTKHYTRMDMARLIAENIDSFMSLKDGTSVVMFDFSVYFTLFGQGDDGNFSRPMLDENILHEWTFMNVKVTKNSRDMIDAKQSIFGSYKGDTEWTADGSESADDYWMDETIYTVSNADFRFTAVDTGYNIQLKDSCISYLDEFSNVVLNVEIDLDEFDSILNIVGFTENPFGDLKINKINIQSDEQRDFVVYQNDWNITTTNVNLIVAGGV